MGKKKEIVMENVSDNIKLNGVQVTREQLNEKIKEAKQQKGMKIVEKSPGEYRTKLED